MTTTPRAASSAPDSRRACTPPSVFPGDPRALGLRLCRGCYRWLSEKHWTTKSGRDEGRCDACMREAWRRRNQKARAKPRDVAVTMPKGWGF